MDLEHGHSREYSTFYITPHQGPLQGTYPSAHSHPETNKSRTHSSALSDPKANQEVLSG